jgi:deoxyribonuclease-4
MDDARRIGVHLPLGGGMVKAAERASEIGATALQVFGDNPTAWRRRAEPPRELATFRARLDELDIRPLAIHAPYLINLAGADRSFATRSEEVLTHELRTAPSFGARFVNVHTGSHRDTSIATGINRLAERARAVLEDVADGPDAAMLVLENSSGVGFGVGSTIEQLGQIADALGDCGVPVDRAGFCLDAAHLWAAGYRVDEPAAIDDLLDEFDQRIGLNRLVMIHLNDSRNERGSGMDRHEHIGAGRIGERGLGHLLRHPRLAHAAFYMETPGMEEGYDAVNMQRARDLLAGRKLATLPPEAFQLSRSRSRSGPADGTG